MRHRHLLGKRIAGGRRNSRSWVCRQGCLQMALEAGSAERAGHRIQFLPVMLMAFPLMLMGLIATVYIYWRYL